MFKVQLPRAARPSLSPKTHVAPCRAATSEVPSTSSRSELPPLEGRIAVLKCTKQGKALFKNVDNVRTIAAYFALPASQYSVLDAAKIERLDDSTFKCYVGGINFFNIRVEPVLTVGVDVRDRGCDIRLLSCELQGSPVAVAQNKKFRASMTNIVRWRDYVPEEGEEDEEGEDLKDLKEVVSETTIQIDLVVPPWFVLPASVVEATGSSIMRSTLNIMVPRFLEQLKGDYASWAKGDDTRKASEGGLGELEGVSSDHEEAPSAAQMSGASKST